MPQITLPNNIKPQELLVQLAKKIDEIIEYPGSVKGDFGHWMITEWIEAKIEQITERRSLERG